MSTIHICGGNPLFGEVFVQGSKNAALPVLAATILCDSRCRIQNIPKIADVWNMQTLLNHLGRGGIISNHCYHCEAAKEIHPFASYDITNRLRASFLVAGPLLAKNGYAEVAYPGGCPIGARPVDLHLKGFRKLGAEVENRNGYIALKAKQLTGGKIYLDFPSVGATENLMMAATLAKGTTVIENAAAEPEILDLAAFLNAMGAKVTGAGTTTVTVEGVSRLSGGDYAIIPDRIEAGTYMLAAAATGGKITVKNVNCEHLKPVIAKLKETGTRVECFQNQVVVEGIASYRAVDIKTLPYPGFPTDLQAQFCAMLACAKGTSIVTETIFENRFLHLAELKRLGANITAEGRTAGIEGIPKLNGAQVRAGDLRASAALIIAGLMAEGETVVEDNGHLLRGYHNMTENLRNLGATISFVP